VKNADKGDAHGWLEKEGGSHGPENQHDRERDKTGSGAAAFFLSAATPPRL